MKKLLIICLGIVSVSSIVVGCENRKTHNHVFVEKQENVIAPTCIQNGSYDLITYCEKCGKVISNEQKIIPALGHDYLCVETPATYEADGVLTYTCSRCGDNYTEKGDDKLIHRYSPEWTYNETMHWHNCIDEGFETLKSNEEHHIFSEFVTPPTSSETGYTTHTCDKCGYSYIDQETDPLGYTITWKNWDGTILNIETGVQLNEMPLYKGDTPTRESDDYYTYLFSGWNPEIVPAVDNAIYTAQFFQTVIDYRIEYILNGGWVNNIIRGYNAKTLPITLKNPTKDGYEFVGWTGSNSETPELEVILDEYTSGDLIFEANWEAITYTIEYILDDGINSADNPSYYNIETDITLKEAQKIGYNFEGWYTDSSFRNKIELLHGHYGNLVLYAKYTPKTFNSTFIFDKGYKIFTINYVCEQDHSVDKTITFTEDDSVDVYDYIPTLSIENSSFLGWYYDKGLTHPVISNCFVAGNLTLYGRCGYESFNQPTHSEKTIHTLLKESTIQSDSTQGGGNLFQYRITEGYYRCPTYFSSIGTISTHVYGGGEPNGMGTRGWAKLLFRNLTTNQTIIDVELKDDELFDEEIEFQLIPGNNYYLQTKCTTRTGTSTQFPVVSSATITAERKPICFYSENEVEQNYGQETQMPNLILEGYDLQWIDENDNLINTEWNYLEDKTFTANWTLHNYSISYELYGGYNNELNPLWYTIDDSIILQNPEKDGYLFGGWFLDEELTNEITTVNGSLSCDLILYAKWIST